MSGNSQIEELVNAFANAVVGQTDSMGRGDSASGNEHARQYSHIFRSIRQIGDPARDEFSKLLRHPRQDVRVMAACYLLRHNTAAALSVLTSESMKGGLIGFEASEAIKRWKDGEWSLDPI